MDSALEVELAIFNFPFALCKNSTKMKSTFIIIALVALFAASSVRASKAGAQVFQAEEVFDINDVLDASEHYDGEVDYVGDFSQYGKLTDEEILDFEEMSLEQEELYGNKFG